MRVKQARIEADHRRREQAEIEQHGIGSPTRDLSKQHVLKELLLFIHTCIIYTPHPVYLYTDGGQKIHACILVLSRFYTLLEV